MNKVECDFCGEECDGKIIIKDSIMLKRDGSEIISCNTCLNHLANKEFHEIKLKEIKE